MFCCLLLLTLYLSVATYSQWLTGTQALTCGWAAAKLPPVALYRPRPELVLVVMAAVTAPATPRLGAARGTGPHTR